jgi:drug/metabolite transporter (DMT)-like permease
VRQTLQSIFWKIFSCACFAGINAIVRYLTGGSSIAINATLPIFVIMFFQNIVGALTFIPYLYLTNKKITITKHYVLNFSRIALATLGIGLWYLSLRYMPITEVIGLGFISPIITILAAIIFLHEKLTFNKSLAIVLTLIGSFFMLRPDKSFGLI